MTITLPNKNLNMTGLGPVLSGVVKTIIIPMVAKATDAQINTFVAIFCIVLVPISLQEPKVKRREHQDNTNIHYQPFQGMISEERQIYTDYDGRHHHHI